MLALVDDHDQVVGQATRAQVIAQSLRHRGVKIFMVTPGGALVFQRRHPAKNICGGLYDVTVGGGVQAGEAYAAAAVREAFEETGLQIAATDLVPIDHQYIDFTDVKSGIHLRCFAQFYGLVYRGALEDLRIEAESGAGFAAFTLDALWAADPGLFIPYLVDRPRMEGLYQRLVGLV
jgi:8-oxo-dGTP pyrophosphatase MutT (NUDIX family)